MREFALRFHLQTELLSLGLELIIFRDDRPKIGEPENQI